jgi:hypothetical protein
MLITEGKGFRAYKPSGRKVVPKIKSISYDLAIHLLPLSADIFRLAYESLPYRSWLNEKASEIDEQELKTYEDGLNRSPETLIMYLMDVGVNSDTLTRLIFASGSNYTDFLRSIQ